MNLIDLGVLAILGLGFLLGWYKGFLVTVCNVASYFLAWIVAAIFYSPLASLICNKTNFNNTLLYYTAGAEKLSDMTVANTDVAALSSDRIKEIINTSSLPAPIAHMMNNNILRQAFSDQGIVTLSDYFNQTIINLTLSLISFLLIFLVVKVILAFLVNMADNIYKLPVLKQHDALFGGVFGVLQGVMIAYVLFSVVPIVMSVLPLDTLSNMLQHSLLGHVFYNGNIIFNILKSVL